MSIYDKMKKRSDDMMNQLKYDKDFNEIYEEIDCFSLSKKNHLPL